MLPFIQSVLGLIATILVLIAAIIGLVVQLMGRTPGRLKKQWGAKAYSGALVMLFIFGVGMLLVRVTYKLPTVAILSPSESIEVTAEGKSVWFPVNGTSSGVFSNQSLTIYVLAYSEPEWHVQRSAPVEADGRWTLTQAWIGDASAPIDVGDQIRLMAVVSRGRFKPDEKFADYRELHPVANSVIVSPRVSTIRGQKAIEQQ